MPQILRPDSDVTISGFTGGFSAIDETPASDADFAFGANNTAALLEVGLASPAAAPGTGTCTLRFRYAKVDDGVPNGGGNAVTVTGGVYQGSTLLADSGALPATGSWQEGSTSFPEADVTDWSDVRLRFTTSASGGSPSNRRGGAVSWAELEVPDAPTSTPGRVKAFIASAWVEKPLKVFDGAQWVEKPLKVFDGAQWVLA